MSKQSFSPSVLSESYGNTHVFDTENHRPGPALTRPFTGPATALPARSSVAVARVLATGPPRRPNGDFMR